MHEPSLLQGTVENIFDRSYMHLHGQQMTAVPHIWEAPTVTLNDLLIGHYNPPQPEPEKKPTFDNYSEARKTESHLSWKRWPCLKSENQDKLW